MDSVNNRLVTILERLKAAELTQTKVTSDINIEKFSKILNLAVPVTEFDSAVGEVIRFMYKHNRASFFKYIHINELVHWVLLTDGMPIVGILGLKGVIMIRWDRYQKEFTVTSSTADFDDAASPKPRQRIRRSASGDYPVRTDRKKFDDDVRKGGYNPNNSRRKEWPAKPTRHNPISPLSSEQCIDILNEARTFQTRASTSTSTELTCEAEVDTTVPAVVPFSWADECEAEDRDE
jgi:hypothetical protein